MITVILYIIIFTLLGKTTEGFRGSRVHGVKGLGVLAV